MRAILAILFLIPSIALAEVWKITKVAQEDGSARLSVEVRKLAGDVKPSMKLTITVPTTFTDAEVDARIAAEIKREKTKKPTFDPKRLKDRTGAVTP